MKRIISLVLTTVLIVVCLAVPVMAEETDTSGWVELLDYGFSSNGSNNIWASSDGVYTYQTPSSYFIRRVELLFTSSLPLESIQIVFNGTDFRDVELFSLGDNLYRATCSSYVSASSVGFSPVFSSDGSSIVNVLSFKVSSVLSFVDSLSYYGHVYDYSYSPIKETYFSGDGSSPMTSVSISPNAGRENFQGFVSRIYLSSWNAYDFISLDIALFSSSFASLKVQADGVPVPYEINTVESTDVLGTSLYLLNILIDTRNLDRLSDSRILVDVSGMVNPTFTGSFTIQSCSGFVSIPSLSLLPYWFTELQVWLSSGFSSVTSSLSTLGTNISNLTSNLSSWISNQTTAILGGFSNLEAHITGRFKVLGSWLSSYFSEQTSFLTNSISSWGQNISNSITSGVDRIVSALSPNGSANDFNDKVQQQGSQLENMAGAMNAVTRPDVSTAIPDIGGFLTVSGPVTLAAVFDPFWKNSYILRLLLGSLAVSVAFTVVYGGKK